MSVVHSKMFNIHFAGSCRQLQAVVGKETLAAGHLQAVKDMTDYGDTNIVIKNLTAPKAPNVLTQSAV
jgi:hypothetical protein